MAVTNSSAIQRVRERGANDYHLEDDGWEPDCESIERSSGPERPRLEIARAAPFWAFWASVFLVK